MSSSFALMFSSRSDGFWSLDRTKTKTLHIISTVMLATAFDASSLAAERLHSGQDGQALGAGIKKLSRHAAAFEWKFMATRLIGNSKIGTSSMPLLAVGFDSLAASPVLSQKVSQLVA